MFSNNCLVVTGIELPRAPPLEHQSCFYPNGASLHKNTKEANAQISSRVSN